MDNKKLSIMILIVGVLLLGCSIEQNENKQLQQHDGEHSIEDFPFEEVSQDEIDALDAAIKDEYKAKAIYEKVINKFGEVKPFINIVVAEQNHINELKEIYDRYNLTVPEDDLYDKVPEFDSVADACAAAVDAEIENAALYDGLFSKVDNQDITAVFTSLRDASEFKHLPAFQRCGGATI